MWNKIIICTAITTLFLTFGTGKAYSQSVKKDVGKDTLKTESNITLGGGVFFESGTYTETPGYGLSVAYGLDLYLGKGWSIMPEVGTSLLVADPKSLNMDGGDTDLFSTVDLAVHARYHVVFENGWQIILGLAPIYSIVDGKDSYYFDAMPDHPLSGKAKLKSGIFSIQPSVQLKLAKHWYLGLQAKFGIGNAAKVYPTLNDGCTKRLNCIQAGLSWHF